MPTSTTAKGGSGSATPSGAAGDAAQTLATELDELQKRYDTLAPSARLTDLRNELEAADFDRTAGGLTERVQQLRTRGYQFGRTLAQEAATLERRWTALRKELREKLEEQANQLRPDLTRLEQRVNAVTSVAKDPNAVRARLTTAKASLADLESKTSLARKAIEEPFQEFKSKLNAFTSRLAEVEAILSHFDQAPFSLQSGESPIHAGEAIWLRGENDIVKGRLFLTDQRLLFEQEAAVKKTLFVHREADVADELILASPLDAIESFQGREGGLIRDRHDRLEVRFGAGVGTAEATFQLPGQEVKTWQELIERAKARGFDQDRVASRAT